MTKHDMRALDLDTPELLLDLPALERNVERMAAFARRVGVSVRPHAKTHKSPQDDADYQPVGVPFECALTVLATVISTPRAGVAIVDAGMKTIAPDHGMPRVLGVAGAEVAALSEEHVRLALAGPGRLEPGNKVRLLPGHGCTTFNLHDRYHVVRDGRVVDVLPVAARGRSQ